MDQGKVINQIEINNNEQQWSESKQISIQQSQQSFSLTKKTSVLSIQQNNQINLKLKEIIALYEQVDNKLFALQMSEDIIIAKKVHFQDIEEVVKQRIVLHSNSNSTVLQAFLRSNKKLIVIKYFSIQNKEILTKKMDEYIIHHKVNKLYPQQRIELIVPVLIQKYTNFQMSSCIERAEIALFDYSQNLKISSQEADIIFQQLLQQVINLHKINIAHRDIKPQNILYVQEKGWLLSDFGESIEYFEVEDMYDIRGTIYFLKSKIKEQMKIGKCKQNLLSNDLYALVVSIIMIQRQNYIQDIEQEINLQNNIFFKQILEVTQLQQLISLYQSLFDNNHNYQPIIKQQFKKQMNQNEQHINDIYILKSCLSLYQYFTINNHINFQFRKSLN